MRRDVASSRHVATSPATPVASAVTTSGAIMQGPERSADACAPHAKGKASKPSPTLKSGISRKGSYS
eukprot:3417330-Lingulodinium_polyedra.AAC.1